MDYQGRRVDTVRPVRRAAAHPTHPFDPEASPVLEARLGRQLSRALRLRRPAAGSLRRAFRCRTNRRPRHCVAAGADAPFGPRGRGARTRCRALWGPWKETLEEISPERIKEQTGGPLLPGCLATPHPHSFVALSFNRLQ